MGSIDLHDRTTRTTGTEKLRGRSSPAEYRVCSWLVRRPRLVASASREGVEELVVHKLEADVPDRGQQQVAPHEEVDRLDAAPETAARLPDGAQSPKANNGGDARGVLRVDLHT